MGTAVMDFLKLGATVGFFIYIMHVALKRLQLIRLISWAPGPFALPVLGNVFELFGLDQNGTFKLWSRLHKKYGTAFQIWIGGEPLITVSHPVILQGLSNRGAESLKSDDYRHLAMFLGESLLTTTGDVWKRKRKMLSPCFHYDILETYMTSIASHSEDFVHYLAPYADTGKPVEILSKSKLILLDILMDAVMGTTVNALRNEDNEYVVAVRKMCEIVMSRSFSPFLRNSFLYNFSSLKREEKKTAAVLKGFVKKVIVSRKEIRKRLSDPGSTDKGVKKKALLDMFLDLVDEGNPISDEEMENEVNTFIFAGHDTTSVCLSYTMYLLGKHPKIQDMIYEELKEKIPMKNGMGISQAEINNLEYLDRCIKESLRRYPPVPIIAKMLQRPLKTEHGLLPTGISILENIFAMHNNDDFFENASAFDPDRFLPEEASKRLPHCYTPFGSGPRTCIGKKFALNELKVLFISVLKKYRIESLEKPEDLKEGFNIVLTPMNGIHIKFHHR